MAAPAYQSASLYVGDLASDVNEALLYEAFKAVGPVVSIRVCRDAVTRRSLGYAYVNFSVPNDAERALDTLNYTPIKGRPMRLMWCHHDPTVRKSGVGNIFIKNLDKSIDNKALFDTFSVFGNILSCKVTTDENGVSRGFGFVHYETAKGAQDAIEKVDGMLLNNKKVFVGPFIPRSSRPYVEKYNNLYFKNIETTVTVDDIKSVFSPFGEIDSAVVMQDDKGVSRGFGFISFKDTEAARNAVEKLNNQPVLGKNIYVARAMKKSDRQRMLRIQFEQRKLERASQYAGVNVYVKNLEDSIDDDKLRAAFSKFGNITSSKVMFVGPNEAAGSSSNAPVSKGFGFVCFSTPEEATRAITEMNGQFLNINGQAVGTKPLYVALAQKKDQRMQQLSAQYEQRMARQAMMAQGSMVPVAGYPNYYGQVPQSYYGNRRYQNRNPNYTAGAAGQAPNFRKNNQRQQRAPQPNNAQRGAPQPAAAVVMPTQPAIDPSMPVEQQKQIIGNRIYPMVMNLLPGHLQEVAKITGMLLDGLAIEDLTALLTSPEGLSARVQEALNVLQTQTETTAQ